MNQSEALFERAQRVTPGGVNSPVRAFRAVGGTPRFLARGEGAYVWDEDGNRYVDLICSWGPLILGHCPPAVVQAVTEQARLATSFGAPTRLEVELAERITQCVPSVEMVRFVNSGTEATMSAIRLARGATGRRLLVKFAGCYHGHADALLVQAGSAALTLGVPNSPGVTPGTAQDTIVLPYNDSAAVEALFAQRGDEVAAVIVEPIAGNMGLVLSEPGFLEGLRAITARHGALLIFDEVISGFRAGLAGAQGVFGIRPDLTCFGKIIGGGLPVGAYGGSRALMEQMAPVGPVYQAGTLSGNPLAMASGLATLSTLMDDPGIYERLEQTGRRLAEGLRRIFQEAGWAAQVVQVGSLLTVFFTNTVPHNLEEAQRTDTARYARFFQAMLERGVMLPPSAFECWFLSAAHGQREVDMLLTAAAEAIR